MRGVVRTRVGYTGGDSKAPNYQSVCSGDGHTEAIKVEFDPATLSYERLLTRFFDDPHVRSVYGDEKPQYKTAIWAQSNEQAAIAQRVSAAAGKTVPILPQSAWYDAEDYHQHIASATSPEEELWFPEV